MKRILFLLFILILISGCKQELTPDECENKGGRVLNTLGGYECDEDEKNIGEVIGLFCPCVCCVEKLE